MAEVTVLVVTQDQADALKLTIESLRRHNTDVKFQLWVWDNNSTDGAQEWARDNCDRLFVKDGPLGCHHGQALDAMAAQVRTPYTLTLDNDMRIDGPFLSRMLEELRLSGAFAANPSCRVDMGTVDHHGIAVLHGQKRIDPCCALFNTHQLATMTKSVSFSSYECVKLRKFFDTGAMIRAAAEGAGMRILDLDWLWEKIHHYASMTWASYAPEGSPVKRQYDDRLSALRADLASHVDSQLASAQVVVAKYREDISWLKSCPHQPVVYDKSGEAGPHVGLPNVGREAHTFAHHVAANYDRLPEVTFFVQGKPFDHVPNILDEFKKPTSRFRALGPHRMITGHDGDSCHRGLPVKSLYESLTGRACPSEITFAPGACFVAHRSTLQRYPKTWWLNLEALLASLETQGTHAWAMERIWAAVLTVPHAPHLYHELLGWFDYQGLYREMVANAPDTGAHFVEVGAWHGRSSKFMATEIFNSRKRIRFDVVDHFEGSTGENEQFMRDEAKASGGSIRATFERNMGEMLPYATVVQKPTPQAAELYADNSLDFVFIDAGHSEEELTADSIAWHPKVKRGGVLAGHDFSGAWPGVERAVRKCFGDDFQFVAPASWKHVKK